MHVPTQDKSDKIKDSAYQETKHVFSQFPKYHTKILLDFNTKVGKKYFVSIVVKIP
jgi:hypothetical protein